MSLNKIVVYVQKKCVAAPEGKCYVKRRCVEYFVANYKRA